MQFKFKLAAFAVASVFPFSASAEERSTKLDPVLVTATGVEMADVDAPYASEVHTRRDIERSGAATLAEYLSRYSSVNVMPNFGNRFTPAIDMRGYGIGDGYQNIVVSVNGRRLNNIDQVPQLLGSVPLGDIERIEITKGSGSVMYGDGAMAGTIQIYTRARTGVTLEGYVGSHGASGQSVAAGVDLGRFAISASAEKTYHDGYSKRDPSGHRDESDSDSWQVSLSAKPVDRLRLSFDAGKTRIDTRYPGDLTQAQFDNDPSQYNDTPNPYTGNLDPYSQQDFNSDYWQAGAEFDLSRELMLSLRHSREDKASAFSSGFASDYDYDSSDLALKFRRGGLALTTGLQAFDGRRAGSDNKTDKESLGWFVHGQYEFDHWLVSAGWRKERVKYAYRPDAGATLKDDEKLSAWDIGVNYRFDDAWSVFANYNSAFQTPDIDRFFVTDWGVSPPVTSFNGFIDPARVRTLNVGFNHVTPANRLKVTVFHAKLRDEIYYNASTFTNTNIDRSHKYGVEVQDSWRISERFTANLNYAWTRAIIDRENDGGGAFNGKNLPGVSRHSAVVSLSAKVGENGSLNLSHSWRSKAYASNDFDNNNAQKTKAYHSTDIAYRHRVARDVELFASVANLFDRENGLWVRDDAIYPVDFTRTWRVGAKISF